MPEIVADPASTTVEAPADNGTTTGQEKTPVTGVNGGASILEGSVDDVKAAATGAEDGGDVTAKAKAEASWPDDWREQMASGNEDVARLLKRYASPGSVATALKSLRTKLDSGDFKKPLSKDATADEVANFRKENGIPETPEDYELPKGLEIGETDKPIIDGFLKYAHENNQTPEQVQGVVDWFFKARQQENEQLFARDEAFRQQSLDTLHEEWGKEFRGNVNGLKGFIESTFGQDMVGPILSARLGDGTAAGDNPAFLKGMVGLMREINPAATLTLPGGDHGGKGVDARIAELEATMRKDIDAWSKDEPAQKEYLELLTTREKLNSRK